MFNRLADTNSSAAGPQRASENLPESKMCPPIGIGLVTGADDAELPPSTPTDPACFVATTRPRRSQV